jgi:hypothetical protein
LLAVDACYQAEQHNTAGAIRSIENLSAVSEALKRGFFIYYIAGCAGQNLSITALEHMLNQGELSGDDLKFLRSIYSDTGRESRLESVMIAERCQGTWAMENMRKAWSQSPVLSKAAVSVIYWLKRTPPIYSDEDYFEYLTMTDAMVTKAHLPLDQRLAAIPGSSTPSKRRSAAFLLIDTQNWQKYIQRDLEALANRSNARVAIAVETYRLQNGKLPAALSELVPAFLPALPLDPFTGKPLHYRLIPRGYLLYSVGADQVDNGGFAKRAGTNESQYDLPFRVER